MKRALSLIGVVGILSAAIASPAAARGLASHSNAANYKVGVVLDVGGVNDRGFNHLAYEGMIQAQAKDHITGKYVVSTGADQYVPNLTQFASQHYKLIIGVGFDMQSAMYIVAKKYPNTKFAMIDGSPLNPAGKNVNMPNVANLFFQTQQSGFLVGVLAGLMEKQKVGVATHNTIGYMGGQSIPPVNTYIHGYIQGAKKVDPSVKILSGYSQSFTDQNKGREIGLAQVGQGADILFQVAGASGLGYLAAAQQKKVYGIGVDADQSFLGSYVITSALKKVDVAVQLIIRDAVQGKFKSGNHNYSIVNGATGFAPTSKAVPQSIVKQVQAYAAQIKSGKLKVNP
jgi:basic membrane protein A